MGILDRLANSQPITATQCNQVKFALKLQELIIHEENRMGRLLVDLQNGWSKTGKYDMELVRSAFEKIIKESKQ